MKNQNSQLSLFNDAELVTPLSGPSYGSFAVAGRRWRRKPLDAILADAVANSQGLLMRLAQGVHCPDREGKPYYQQCFEDLWQKTEAQLRALETFRAVDWSE
jgi:hypothetical protein